MQERLTKQIPSKEGYPLCYAVEEQTISSCADGYGGQAVDKLAKFENALDFIQSSLDKAAADLQKLRDQGKSKSVTFKQLLAQKMTYQQLLDILSIHGI